MSSISAILDESGKITNLGNENKDTKKSNDTVNKEQFLQLLVAQMKYQDPLEPTDNTEYVSQLAQFSELEQMQNLAASNEMARGNSLVGKLVTVSKTDSTTGMVTEETGKVDYVLQQGTKIMISVNDTIFNLDDLVQVWDSDYADAYALAEEWSTSYNSLPGVNNITANNAKTVAEFVQNLFDTYNEMSVYQKTFLSKELQAGLQEYIDTLKQYGYEITTDGLKYPGSETETETGTDTGKTDSADKADSTNQADGTDNTEGTEKTDGTANSGNAGSTDTENTTDGVENADTVNTANQTTDGDDASGAVADNSDDLVEVVAEA